MTKIKYDDENMSKNYLEPLSQRQLWITVQVSHLLSREGLWNAKHQLCNQGVFFLNDH